MKNFSIVFIAIMLFSLSSCQEDTKEESVQTSMENFTLKTESLKSLSPFSISYKINEIKIKKNSSSSYRVSTIRYNDESLDSITDTFDISIIGNILKISVDFTSNKYFIEKNTETNQLYFSINNEKEMILENSLQNIKENDLYALNRLITLYVELYDNTIRKMGPETDILAKKTCAMFESNIGFTGTAASIRSIEDAQAFIANGHGDCSIKGTDISCAGGNHVCLSTTTMQCSGATCSGGQSGGGTGGGGWKTSN